MIKIIICFLIFLSKVIVSEEAIGCPQRNGIFANPNDCISFILCNNFVAELKSCPNGLHFNPSLKVCDFPEQSGCEAHNKIITNFNCPEGTRLYQDPENCHSFYMCSEGRSHHFECPAGLIFYPQRNRCDYPETNGFLCFDSLNKFPNTSDCKMYLDCSQPIEGYACPRLCPQTLHFNRYLEECVTPEKSLCTDQSSDQLNHSMDDTNNDSNDESNSLPDPSDAQEPGDTTDLDYISDSNSYPSPKFNDYMEIFFPPNLFPFSDKM